MPEDREAVEAAIRLAEKLLRMRIDISSRAFDNSGYVSNPAWAEVYRLLREYEDAEVRDMLNGKRLQQKRSKKKRRRDRKRKRIRDATDRVVVEKKRAGQHSEKHPWRATARKKNLTPT
jgi:hypothetical protein